MTDTVQLDIRPVEPKDQFERIMSACEGLLAGAPLELTVEV